MNSVYISLGSNRGDRKAHINRANELLSQWGGTIVNRSSLYETPPWKMEDETNFINQVIELHTTHSPDKLLDIMLQLEQLMGRVRTAKGYEPRTIDLDILFFNNEIIENEKLIIPHPLIQERKFVLEPMAEIAPSFVHPGLHKAISVLLSECEDKSPVQKSVSK